MDLTNDVASALGRDPNEPGTARLMSALTEPVKEGEGPRHPEPLTPPPKLIALVLVWVEGGQRHGHRTGHWACWETPKNERELSRAIEDCEEAREWYQVIRLTPAKGGAA